jgi:hypothetical protein
MAVTYSHVYGIAESGTNLIASLRLDNGSNTFLNSGDVIMTETGTGSGTLSVAPIDGVFSVDYEDGNQTNDGWLVSTGAPLTNDGDVYYTNQADVLGYETGIANQNLAGQTTWHYAGQVISPANVYVRLNASGNLEYFYDTAAGGLGGVNTSSGALPVGKTSIPGGSPRPLPDDTNSSSIPNFSFAFSPGVADANGWYLLWEYDQYIADLWSNTTSGANWGSGAVIMTQYSLSDYISTQTGGTITQIPNNMDLGYIEEEDSVCFLAGSRVLTSKGEVAVEDLQRGDLVITDQGPKPVKFLGRRLEEVASADNNNLPICIPAGSLGSGIPSLPLYVSPGHAICLEGQLIQASALVGINGIHQVSPAHFADQDSFTYYSIELESHRLIKVNNTSTESFFDILPRTCWRNFGEYLSLYGQELPIEELPLPRILFQRNLSAALRLHLQINAPALAVL